MRQEIEIFLYAAGLPGAGYDTGDSRVGKDKLRSGGFDIYFVASCHSFYGGGFLHYFGRCFAIIIGGAWFGTFG